jgi:RNA polymerase sigma factor (sigma-70 family)
MKANASMQQLSPIDNRMDQYLALLTSSKAIFVYLFGMNDEKAIQQLYTDVYPIAERHILANTGNREQAKDVFQEAFIAVWRNVRMERFTPRHDNSLKSYLMQVVKNKWIDHLRSAQHRNTVPLDESAFENEPDSLPAEQLEKIALIKKHFGSLGDVCRELLRRFYYEKQSMSIIARAFNWTEATARNNKYRCVEKLRSALQLNKSN